MKYFRQKLKKKKSRLRPIAATTTKIYTFTLFIHSNILMKIRIPNVCRLDHKLTGELILASGLNEDINVGYSVNKTASEYTLNNLFQFKLLAPFNASVDCLHFYRPATAAENNINSQMNKSQQLLAQLYVVLAFCFFSCSFSTKQSNKQSTNQPTNQPTIVNN